MSGKLIIGAVAWISIPVLITVAYYMVYFRLSKIDGNILNIVELGYFVVVGWYVLVASFLNNHPSVCGISFSRYENYLALILPSVGIVLTILVGQVTKIYDFDSVTNSRYLIAFDFITVICFSEFVRCYNCIWLLLVVHGIFIICFLKLFTRRH